MRQSGSALLVILLLLATIGSILLTASKAAIDISRAVSSNSDNRAAYMIARAGIYEGLSRIWIGNTDLVNGEYGNGMSTNPVGGYSLTVLSRGYTDTACTLVSGDGLVSSGGFNTDCPYYDLTVRHYVALSSGQTFDYSSRELPKNVTITLNLMLANSFTFHPSSIFTASGGNIDYKVYNSSGSNTYNAVAGDQIIPSNSTKVDITVRNKDLVADSGTPANRGLLIQNIAAANQLVIDKGYITIDSDGHFGTTESHLILYLRQQDGNLSPIGLSRTLLPATQLFDQNGLLQ